MSNIKYGELQINFTDPFYIFLSILSQNPCEKLMTSQKNKKKKKRTEKVKKEKEKALSLSYPTVSISPPQLF